MRWVLKLSIIEYTRCSIVTFLIMHPMISYAFLGNKSRFENWAPVLIVVPFAFLGVMYYIPKIRSDSKMNSRWNEVLFSGWALDRLDCTFILAFSLIQLNWFVFRLAMEAEMGKWSRPLGLVKSIAKTLGMNALLTMGVALISATRNFFCLQQCRIGYDRSIRYHIWLSFLTILLLGVHGGLYWFVWIMSGEWKAKALPCSKCSEKKQYKTLRNFFGAVAFLFSLLLLWTSRASFRRERYLFFYVLHHILVAAFVISSSIHFQYFVNWTFIPLWLWLKSTARSFLNRKKVQVLQLTEVSPGYIRMVLSRGRNSYMGEFGLGQFVYIKIPEISCLAWHPFSISSSPLEHESYFTIHIQVHHRKHSISKKLLQYCRSGESDNLKTVIVDGYFGCKESIEEYDHLILIAGGIGATPLLSMVEHAALLHENGRETSLTFILVVKDLELFRMWMPQIQRALKVFGSESLILYCSTSEKRQALHATPVSSTMAPLDSSYGANEFFDSMAEYDIILFLITLGLSMYLTYSWLYFGKLTTLPFYLLRIVAPIMVGVGAFLGGFLCSPLLDASKSRRQYAYAELFKKQNSKSYDFPPKKSVDISLEIRNGRPDLKEYLKLVLKDEITNNKEQIGIFVSGPSSMVEDTRISCAGHPKVSLRVKSFQW